MARLLLIVVVDLFRFVKKEQRIGANSSKNNYIGTKKPEIKKPFAFPLFPKFVFVGHLNKRRKYALWQC